jgi:hypothetical protein
MSIVFAGCEQRRRSFGNVMRLADSEEVKIAYTLLDHYQSYLTRLQLSRTRTLALSTPRLTQSLQSLIWIHVPGSDFCVRELSIADAVIRCQVNEPAGVQILPCHRCCLKKPFEGAFVVFRLNTLRGLHFLSNNNRQYTIQIICVAQVSRLIVLNMASRKCVLRSTYRRC